MTDKCGGGPSGVRTGAPTEVDIGGSALLTILTDLTPWAVPVALLLDTLVWATQEACITDPPPMPTFDAADAAAVVKGWLSADFWRLEQKLGAVIQNYMWDRYCECLQVPTPTPTPPPAPPPASFTTAATTTACFAAGWAGNVPLYNGGDLVSQALDLTTTLCPVLPNDGPIIINDPYPGLKVYPARFTPTQVRWTSKTAVCDDPTATIGPNVHFLGYTAAHELRAQWGPTGVYTERAPSGFYDIDPAITYFAALGYVNAGQAVGCSAWPDTTVSVNQQWFCGATHNDAESCCPPDPTIALTLSNILQIVNDIETRLRAPGGYVDGIRHRALTGTGSLVLEKGTVALRVETIPPNPPTVILPGTPSYYFDMGFITPYVLGSPLRSTRLTFVPQTITLPTFTDQIGWTLLNGVSVDIVELELAASPATH